MSIGTIVIGLALIAAGALCVFVLRNKLSGKAVDVQYMKTTPAAELKQTFADMASGGLDSNFRQYVELQGVAASATPPHAPYSQQSVAFYEAELVQVYEIQENYTDDQGRQQQRTVRKEQSVTNERSAEPLLLKDAATGETVMLDLQDSGLHLDLVNGCDRFEPTENMNTYGFFNAYIPRQLGSRTLGYRLKERIIPLGQQLYVLGEAYMRNGGICVGRPSDSKKSFIVSTKSEAQIVREAKTGSTIALIGGAALALGGVAVAVIGFFTK
jgi:hypothetical protein